MKKKALARKSVRSVPRDRARKPIEPRGVAVGSAAEAGPARAVEEQAPRRPQHAFPVVGIGASAGGLEAFRRLLGALPADSGMAYVLVQHLDPSHESILAELLSEATRMPVSELKGDVPVEPDHVYVIPPSRDIGIAGGTLKLVPRSQTGGLHMPIDYFLRMLAEAQGSQAIGVILSGTASDGTLGLKAIKAEGGIAFAQDPESAGFDGMPRSAIAAGCVDFILPPEEIARELSRLGRHPYVAADEQGADRGSSAAPMRTLEEDGLQKILVLLRKTRGADFGAYKKTTLQRRIARRMAVNRIETLEEYARRLEGDASEVEALYQDCLISVTSFFRDPESFEALSERVFATLLSDRPAGTPIRVWVPGCATGEEAYSIAICLLERAGALASSPRFQVFATDLSESAIEKARAGTYLESIAQDVSPERLRRFFSKANGHYVIDKALRELCVFARHDLAKDPPFSRMDLVSCRNVLIYMEPRLQERVIATFHYALNPWGFLMLGPSEGIGASSPLFAPVDKKHKIYSRKTTTVPPHFRFAPAAGAAGEPASAPLTPRAAFRSEVMKEADRILLARYAPAGVVVDEGLSILEFCGDTHPYLEHAHGQASLNLIRMARKGLLLKLREAIAEATRNDAASRKKGVPIRYRGQLRSVSLEVVPIKGAAARDRCLLVLFEEERTNGAVERRARPSSRSLPTDAKDREIANLEQRLAETTSYLHSIVQEHEAALEELQSSNEEALSSNEELLSVNEELQTAKEEVQSANEELATLNQELQDRNAQLRQANEILERSGDEVQRALDYANAIVATVREPLLILDGELRVEKANRAYYETFGVRPETTVGRLLYELGNGQWDLPALRAALTESLPKDTSFEDFEVERAFPVIGLRTMALNARHLRYADSGKERILLAIEDRTEVKRATQGREALLALEQAAREQAEAADQLKDEFVATVSHELRGPLTSMMGWMHLLTHGGTTGDEVTLATALTAIERGLKTQTRLIGDLLDHSRIVTGKLQLSRRLIDLVSIAEASLEGVRAAAEAKGIALELRRDARATIVLGDPDRMQQVAWNLLFNAVKFTPRGGRVQVWIGRAEHHVHLRVTDSGQGIAPEFLPHVFDRFRQAEGSPQRNQPGLGLGLALVRHLVELHGGTVRAESPGKGQGATFTVTLPIPAVLMEPAGVEAEEPPRPDLSAPEEPAREPDPGLLDGVSVLVVEDDEDSREALATVLGRYGARVMKAGSAGEAIDAFEAAIPDVLVSDIGMPGADGYDLIRSVRNLAPERGGRLPALALTAYAGDRDRRKAAEAGFQDLLVKPVAPAKLVTMVARLARALG